MDTDSLNALDAAVWKLELLARMQKHGLVSQYAGVGFLDSPECASLVAFAHEMYELGTHGDVASESAA